MLHTLSRSLRENKGPALVTVLLSALEVVFEIVIPLYMSNLIDFGIEGGSMAAVWKFGAFLLLLAAFQLATGVLAARIAARTSVGFGANLREDMYNNVQTFAFSNIDKFSTASIVTRLTTDVTNVQNAFQMCTRIAVRCPVMLIFAFVMAAKINRNMALIFVAVLPVLAIGLGILMKMVGPVFERVFKIYDRLNTVVQENVHGIRVVKAFAQEDEDFKQFEKACENSREKNLAVVKLRAVFGPTLDAVIGISVIVTLLAGGRMVLDGQVSIGQFVAFNSYIDMLVWPMIAAGDCINTFSQAAAAWGRIRTIFEEKPDIVDMVPPENVIENDGMAGSNTDNLAEGIYDKIQIHGDIQLSHLSFTYPDGTKPVLSDVSIHVKQGEMLGILGRTGSGKSSLADLLLRVYDCENGMILLDGRPITDYPLAVLHRDISYVPQENFLFSDTLEENIAFGLEDRIADNPAILDAVKQAAKDACIHDNIMGFPDEYKTMVGERGVTLSGGQKQRSSIARALLKDSAILILDDSLSAVDTDTEEQILENLMETRQGKTTIVIAHRISTLQKADHVAVLSDGKLTEYGTPEELLELGGFYADISHKQQLESELGS